MSGLGARQRSAPDALVRRSPRTRTTAVALDALQPRRRDRERRLVAVEHGAQVQILNQRATSNRSRERRRARARVSKSIG
jgi:hypothetical protein